MKVRQPLGMLTVSGATYKITKKELFHFLEDEVNVKEVVVDDALAEGVVLDTTVTPALKEEGMMREITRHIQQARKDDGLTKKDVIVLRYCAEEGVARAFALWGERMMQRVVAKKIEYIARDAMRAPREIAGDDYHVWFEIQQQ